VSHPLWQRLTIEPPSLVRDLPVDPLDNLQPRRVQHAVYSNVRPTPTASPRLLAWSDDVAAMLGMPTFDNMDASALDSVAQVLSGNEVVPGMMPIATRYGGHQFGHFAGQLGDGRAMSIGDVVMPSGQRWELQLKGAGPTPYSRRADGRAVLRSSLREFVCSEAMHAMGIPTTRALSLVATGDRVMRDMLYDGHPAPEPGAVVCRVAPSFLRFGHYELPAAEHDIELLSAIHRHVVSTHFVDHDANPNNPDAVVAWFAEVARRNLSTVIHWQRVGFVHGVMNTDNCSLLGLTIDYGPYGFLEPYDPGWTPNTTDAQHHRYRAGAQLQVMMWNLSRLAESLLPLLLQHWSEPQAEAALMTTLREVGHDAATAEQNMWASKFGLDGEREDHLGCMAMGLELMESSAIDFTLWFRALSHHADGGADRSHHTLLDGLEGISYQPMTPTSRQQWSSWLSTLTSLWSGAADAGRPATMMAVNPIYVPRNWLAQEAIDAAMEGDMSLLQRWMRALRQPYQEQPDASHFASKRPSWAEHKVGCSMLSCSS
jgi:serine/tyrosine/threonine adenylyltransferase